MIEYVKISKSGGSLVIALPRSIRDALGLARGDRLALVAVGHVLSITRVDPKEESRRFVGHRVTR